MILIGDLRLPRNGDYPIPGSWNLVLLVAVAASCAFLLRLASHGSTWTVVVAAITFAFLNNTMFALLHESVHGIAHAHRGLNEWIGRLAAAFFPTGLALQRVFHLAHHARNRTAAEQFDYVHPGDNVVLKYAQWYAILTGLYWLFVPLGGLVYFIVPRAFQTRFLGARDSQLALQTGGASMFAGLADASGVRIRLELLCSAAVQVAMFQVLDLSWTGWLACYAAFALNWSSLQYTDHAFSKLDVRDGAWNLRVNGLTRRLFLNYHHHLAHHRHPQVPWIHLGGLVDRSEERPSFWTIYLQMWRGPRPLPANAEIPDAERLAS
ncbi:MAG: fatty acid desaturase [Thermoanaerobaculia bacterium]|jgi:fatty acid desaturase